MFFIYMKFSEGGDEDEVLNPLHRLSPVHINQGSTA